MIFVQLFAKEKYGFIFYFFSLAHELCSFDKGN